MIYLCDRVIYKQTQCGMASLCVHCKEPWPISRVSTTQVCTKQTSRLLIDVRASIASNKGIAELNSGKKCCRPIALLRTHTHTHIKSETNCKHDTKPPIKCTRNEVLGGRWELFISEQEGSLSPFFERARQRNRTRGPAHDKTKRLNDLWMWLSIPPLARTQLRGLLPPPGGWRDVVERDVPWRPSCSRGTELNYNRCGLLASMKCATVTRHGYIWTLDVLDRFRAALYEESHPSYTVYNMLKTDT